RAVLQHGAGDRDADRPLLAHHPDPGDRRLARPQEVHSGRRRHSADAYAAVRRAAGRHGAAGRRPDVCARAGAGARRGTSANDGGAAMTSTTKARPLFDPPIVRRAIVDSFKKLDPRRQVRNPVMFTVYVGSILTTGLGGHAIATHSGETFFTFAISAWLWFTVLFANFAEAMAEGRGKAQADTLRQTRRDVVAK